MMALSDDGSGGDPGVVLEPCPAAGAAKVNNKMIAAAQHEAAACRKAGLMTLIYRP